MFTVNLTGHRGVSVVKHRSYFCVCLSVQNKRHKTLHCTSSWIRTTFIKSQHVCMGCSRSRGWSLILWDGPYFSVFLQECFAWSSRASAGQWLMSQRWRCSEDCRCTSQDKTPHKSTNYLTFYLAVYFSPFLQPVLWFDCCYLHGTKWRYLIKFDCLLHSLKFGALIWLIWWQNKSVTVVFIVSIKALQSGAISSMSNA